MAVGALVALVLVPMLLQDGVLDEGLLVEGQHAGVDHVVESELANVFQVGGCHVETDGAVEKHGPQLEQRVQRQGGHVGLGPPVAALLHVLFKLDPPEHMNYCKQLRRP